MNLNKYNPIQKPFSLEIYHIDKIFFLKPAVVSFPSIISYVQDNFLNWKIIIEATDQFLKQIHECLPAAKLKKLSFW